MAKSPRSPSIPPQISSGKAIVLIRQQIERLDSGIMEMHRNDPRVKGWLSTTESILNAAFGQPNGGLERRTYDFKYISSGMPIYSGMSEDEYQRDYTLKQQKRKALLESYVEQLEILALKIPHESRYCSVKLLYPTP